MAIIGNERYSPTNQNIVDKAIGDPWAPFTRDVHDAEPLDKILERGVPFHRTQLVQGVRENKAQILHRVM